MSRLEFSATIQKHLKGDTMKLSELFSDPLLEGTWAVPNTVDKAKKLVALFKKPIPLNKAHSMLYHLIGDDDMFDSFDSDIEHFTKNKTDPSTIDVRSAVKSHLRRLLKTKWNKAEPEALSILNDFLES